MLYRETIGIDSLECVEHTNKALCSELLVRNLFLCIIIVELFRYKESNITKRSDYHVMSTSCIPI
jgi:hypothetical protein